MIETSKQLTEFLDAAAKRHGTNHCAIDTEADSLHRYSESLCLVQFAIGGEIELIDPLAIDDLQPLANFLAERTVWMHGADYDMTMLKREFGEIPATVFDTQIGARLLGVRRYGLGDLVEHYFGVTLLKSSQKADWGKRPLSEKMVDYALNDVKYLLEMGDIIVGQLKELGRYEWFLESCVVARQKVLERTEEREDNWRIGGAGKLSREGLAYLKHLWHWRDGEAKAWDRPTFMVCGNKQLIEWCTQLCEGKEITLPRHFRPNRQQRFQAALDKAKALSEDQWPSRPKTERTRRPKDFDSKLDALMNKRNQCASDLDIETSLIAPRATLEALASGHGAPEELLMKWQRECLGL